MTNPSTIDIVTFDEIDRTQLAAVGGKGAHLGELARIAGVRVPPGFCVTTDAYARIVAPAIDDELAQLARVAVDDRAAIAAASARVRRAIEAIAMPEDLAAAIAGAVARLGADGAYAVRSSATAEDLPTASFAGQQDTYLNVVGAAAIVAHVRRCWASLFTERAVTYRLRHGFDQRRVQMAVVVQRMVVPQVAGILFTADPVTGNRKVVSIDASFGLGEALVAGLVNPDVYKVRAGAVIDKTIAVKERAIEAVPGGGTRTCAVAAERQREPALTDAQIVRLAQLGRTIEAQLGGPQDIEWCLADDEVYVVQSRPITTLFPIPAGDDGANHVYICVGHQQMMTDPMRPLGLSLFQLIAGRPMYEAAGRLFVDVARALAAPEGRAGLMAMIGRSEPLIGDALRTIVERGDFLPAVPDAPPAAPSPAAARAAAAAGAPAPIETDPAIPAALIAQFEASNAAAQRAIAGLAGPALFAFILDDLRELQRLLFDPRSHQVYMTAIEASWWLNDHVQTWLGDKNVADTLTLSVDGNVTSEMGLALMAVADAIRPHAEVVAFLERVATAGARDAAFLGELAALPGGAEARAAIDGFLATYGMRCVGEIDITRPRWSEQPATLLPMLLGNVRAFEAGAGPRRFAQGRREALAKQQDVLARLRALPDGEAKAAETAQMIDRVRTFIGYREYPKYGKICRLFVYRQALLAEAARLVAAGVVRAPDDIYYLTFQELHEAARTQRADAALIRRRREAHATYEALMPPRVMTSDGEVITGTYRRADVPAGALVGLAVSAGTIEGRARVILDVADADLAPGDILITRFTDPSWTPLFVAIAGLVTEVGGLMTHGAVIAREYGVPAVVGVVDATRRIRDGQRIRVHGTEGYVELLS